MNQLQIRNLALYNLGRVISFAGSGIQTIAMPLYILDLTGSGALMGIFTMLSMIPLLVTSPLAGVLGDRLNRKLISVYTDFGRGLLVILLAWFAFRGSLNIPILFTCQVLISIMDSFFSAATTAMLPDLSGEEALSKANAARGVMDSLAFITGPVLGGIIYGIWGIQMIFLLNALSFIFSGICETLIIYQFQLKNNTQLSFQTFGREIREVWLFIINHQGLKQLCSFALFSNFLIAPIIMVGIPFILKKVIGFNSNQYGYIMAGFTLGLLIGNLLIGIFPAKDSGKLMKTGLIVNGSVFVVLPLVIFPRIITYFNGPSWRFFIFLGIGFIIAGLFNALVNTPMMTNFQIMVPAEIRSRFFAVLSLFSQMAIPLGAVIYGFLLDRFPAHWLLLVLGAVILIINLIFIMFASPQVYDPQLTVKPAVEED